jgi:hypothetical protein
MSAAFLTIPSAERLQVLAASEQTGGAFGLVAATLTPGETPPPHIRASAAVMAWTHTNRGADLRKWACG